MRDRDTSSYTHEVRELGHRLSPSDLRQIDAWIDWWFDTDTRFGLVNAFLAALGAFLGLVWAVVSAVTGGITPGVGGAHADLRLLRGRDRRGVRGGRRRRLAGVAGRRVGRGAGLMRAG